MAVKGRASVFSSSKMLLCSCPAVSTHPKAPFLSRRRPSSTASAVQNGSEVHVFTSEIQRNSAKNNQKHEKTRLKRPEMSWKSSRVRSEKLRGPSNEGEVVNGTHRVPPSVRHEDETPGPGAFQYVNAIFGRLWPCTRAKSRRFRS